MTANAVMLAAVYGKSIQNDRRSLFRTKAERYICWAKGQVSFWPTRTHISYRQIITKS